MNWTPAETVKKIQDTWGKYNPEMLALVFDYLANKNNAYCRAAYAVLADYHDGNWPPTRAVLHRHRDEISARSVDYAELIPVSQRLTESTEPYADQKIGMEKFKIILGNIGKKSPGGKS